MHLLEFQYFVVEIVVNLGFGFLKGKINVLLKQTVDKVLGEEIMTNDDNLESNLLTSSLLKMRSLYKLSWRFQVMN